MLKAVILVGGPQKGTRFRPLSFDIPKPLFPVAGLPMLQHLIEACCRVPTVREILVIGFYPADEGGICSFISTMSRDFKIPIRYLQEYTALGTAGGIHHFRDQIRRGDPDAFFLINGDVCGNFPLLEMLDFHNSLPSDNMITMLGTEATRQQSLNYGCIAENKATHEVLHYVEKPSTFVSSIINCGIYLCSPDIFQATGAILKEREPTNLFNSASSIDSISLEQDIVALLAAQGGRRVHVYLTDLWWSQMKTAGSAIYANRHYLELYHKAHPERLAQNGTGKPAIIGDVFIHPTATVDKSATLGPNVSIGPGATVGSGVRIRESIILGNAVVNAHSLVLHSIVGWNSTVGTWTRVEGTPCDPNPNRPFAKMENVPLFNTDGRLNPSITVLGCNVTVPSEVVVLNSIVLPHKDLGQSYKNEIIL
ncbi:mannose-1-phosphate guanyltransferase alpha-A-like [Ornithodoros turicata]|uniref:Putative gdp-mannose pyrophosphorylase/mannose-1-phosphate guanylyltransferase n=1 Tax=Ornithodoros turicata TaxID=34597 RepID=A0A2R5LLN9_9ACAR